MRVRVRACVRALFKTSLRSKMARENSYEPEDRKGVKNKKARKVQKWLESKKI